MVLLPLESNPDVMNKFIHLLGVPEKWNIVDVYGLDSDALAWIPRPVLALILLFPCSEKAVAIFLIIGNILVFAIIPTIGIIAYWLILPNFIGQMTDVREKGYKLKHLKNEFKFAKLL